MCGAQIELISTAFVDEILSESVKVRFAPCISLLFCFVCIFSCCVLPSAFCWRNSYET